MLRLVLRKIASMQKKTCAVHMPKLNALLPRQPPGCINLALIWTQRKHWTVSFSSEEFKNEEAAASIRNLFESQPFTINETEWRGSKFFDSMHVGGRAILEYNMDHEFFDESMNSFPSSRQRKMLIRC